MQNNKWKRLAKLNKMDPKNFLYAKAVVRTHSNRAVAQKGLLIVSHLKVQKKVTKINNIQQSTWVTNTGKEINGKKGHTWC